MLPKRIVFRSTVEPSCNETISSLALWNTDFEINIPLGKGSVLNLKFLNLNFFNPQLQIYHFTFQGSVAISRVLDIVQFTIVIEILLL